MALLDKSWFILEDEENHRLQDVKEILEGFISWERFDHKGAIAHFNQVKILPVEIQKKYLDKVLTNTNRINARLASLYKSTELPKDEKKEKMTNLVNVPTIDLVLDVFHNARRRSEEGNYDDAVARLYRCLEMLEQHLLFMEHNLLTSDIDLEELKDKILSGYFQKLYNKKKYEKQTVEIGLVEGFEILSYLSKKHPMTEEYLKNKDIIKKCLRYRNLSILAHGINPISKQDYELMEVVAKRFIESIVSNIDNHLKDMEHLFDVNVLASP